jgi:enoyl-CoA hydratase/carnithine racemase
MTPFLAIERDGAILTVRMDSPATRNALSTPSQMQEFVDLCTAVRLDRGVKVVVLTGNGPAFCAGGNVKDMAERGGIFAGSPYEVSESYRNGIQRIPMCLYNLDVPVIAALNGPAIGAGLDLACMCDVRIAADTAKFAESFVKLGIVPGDGGCWLLPRVVGASNAALLALTGDVIDADEALRIGLVSKVVAPEALLDEAMALARRIAANPPQVLRWTKALLQQGRTGSLDESLRSAGHFQGLAHQTADHAEALAAFTEKRAATYRGE